MTKKELIEIVDLAFSEKADANDIFIMFKSIKEYEIFGWEDFENIIEEVFEERPDWQKCKKIMIGKLLKQE